MAVYFVCGVIRSGKGLYSASVARRYYSAGRRVAANYDFDTFAMCRSATQSIFRLPDKPRIEDLKLLGRGCNDDEKDMFGAIFLDECATWLNTRDFRDKERANLIDWFIHSGKLGWDVYIQVQSFDMIDKQILDATGEHIIEVNRLDRLRLPLISDVLEMFSPKRFGKTGKSKGFLPHYISAKTYLGKPGYKNKPIEKELFPAKSAFGLYDTNYVFTNGTMLLNGNMVDMRCCYSLLPGATISKLYYSEGKKKRNLKPLRDFIILIVCIIIIVYFAKNWFFNDDSDNVPASENVKIEQNEPLKQNIKVDTLNLKNVKNKTPVSNESIYSEDWRITGYTQKRFVAYYILAGNNGEIRYFRSTKVFDGRRSEIMVDGKIVNYYTGIKKNEKNMDINN